MVKTAKFTVLEKFVRKQCREKYKSKRSSKNSGKSITKLKPSGKLCKLSKVKQDAQAYASASHPVIDYNKNIRS